MIVLDASAVVDLLLDTDAGTRVGRRVRGEGAVAVPHLLDVEVTQVMRRLVRAKLVAAARAQLAVTDLASLPLLRYSHEPLIERAFALRDNCTIYDAVYVVLAAALDATLVTRDERLGRLPLRRVARIEVVG